MGAAAKKERGALSEAALVAMLAERFAAPEYAFIPQVRNATGASRITRTADAVAMSLWPSRGMELHGFEVKSYRTDWTREKSDPAKAEEIASYCDRWWLVVADEEIVQAGELPGKWGLIAAHGEKLRVIKEAVKLDGKALDRPFVAALLRRAAKVVINRDDIDAAVEQARAQERAHHTEMLGQVNKRTGDEVARLRGIIQAFETAAGIRLEGHAWDGPDAATRAGAAMKWFLAGGMEGDRKRLALLRNEAAGILASIDGVLGKVEG